MTHLACKTRFAPSPTGEIHLGNVRTALFNALQAGHEQGVFLLRIEDTDAERSKAEYVDALERDLRWLGIDWEEGPEVGGAHGPYFQAQRGETYAGYYRQLEEAGRAYPCFCSEQQLKLSRKAQRAAGQPPRYAGTCARLSAAEVDEKVAAGLNPTLRYRVPKGETVDFEDLVRGNQSFRTDEIGDFIIRRADGSPAFFFSNAVDDALMEVTQVLRGEDHLTNTPRQILILAALGLRLPRYGHISLIVGADGSPLSKRHGSRSVRQLREQGYLPTALNNFMARLGHKYEQDDFLSPRQMAEQFSLARLGKAPARYDEAQLRYWQKEAVLRADAEELWPWLAEIVSELSALVPEREQAAFVQALRENIELPADALHWARRIFTDDAPGDADAQAAVTAAGAVFFQQALSCLDSGAEDFRAYAKAVGKAAGVKGKGLFMPLRAALTNAVHGPDMSALWVLLGEQRIRTRLQAAAERCR